MVGSGALRAEAAPVAGFDAVVLNGPGSLVLTQGSAERLTVEAEDNVLSALTHQVRGGRLELGVGRGRDLRPTRPIRYLVTMPAVRSVWLDGPGDLDAPSIRADRLDLHISGPGQATIAQLEARVLTVSTSGSGTARIAGDAGEQWVSIAGHGAYQAGDLLTKDAHISILGFGACTVRVTDTLDLKVSGSADVRYVGLPTIDLHVTGQASVAPAEPP